MVVDELLKALDETSLMVEWTKSGFIIRYPSPVNPTAPLFLASVYAINGKGLTYAWQGQLRHQIENQFKSSDTAKRIVEQQKRLFLQFGGVPTAGADQINIMLHTMRGREQQFVEGLAELATEIAAIPDH
jgi:hypothetical protein